VTINDRGPFSHRDRIIDLSRKAGERIDMIGDGVVPVRVEIVSMPK
jgi:rare lipoprotein A